MEIIEVITNVVGDSGRYEVLIYVFISALVLVCADNILKFVIGSITSLFKGK